MVPGLLKEGRDPLGDGNPAAFGVSATPNAAFPAIILNNCSLHQKPWYYDCVILTFKVNTIVCIRTSEVVIFPWLTLIPRRTPLIFLCHENRVLDAELLALSHRDLVRNA